MTHQTHSIAERCFSRQIRLDVSFLGGCQGVQRGLKSIDNILEGGFVTQHRCSVQRIHFTLFLAVPFCHAHLLHDGISPEPNFVENSVNHFQNRHMHLITYCIASQHFNAILRWAWPSPPDVLYLENSDSEELNFGVKSFDVTPSIRFDDTMMQKICKKLVFWTGN